MTDFVEWNPKHHGHKPPYWTPDMPTSVDGKNYVRQPNWSWIAGSTYYVPYEAVNIVPRSTTGDRAMSDEALKPCPFCGEQCATLVIDQGDKWAHYEPSCLEVRTGYDLSDDAAWRAEAISAWNTRIEPFTHPDNV